MARYALVVGISDYSDPALPNLTNTVNDAKAIAKVLKASNTFQKVKVLGGTVTQAEFEQALLTLLEEAANNEAVLYYTGHAVTEHRTKTFGVVEKSGHIVTSDSRVMVDAKRQCIQVVQSIPLTDFNSKIRESNLSNLVVFLDCCHSEYFLDRQSIEKLTAFSFNRDYYFVTACRTTEEARFKKSEAHSVFTGPLLEALSPDNADEEGGITGDRVFDYLYRRLRNSGQEPIRMGWGRSIPIVSYPKPTTEPATPFDPTNPYVGLKAFDQDQAQYFFGRESSIRILLERLVKARFLAVLGASGSGKSSLVKAGVLPQLAFDRVIESLPTPGPEPVEALHQILQRRQASPNERWVLFIDQFEELFTLCHDREKQQIFVEELVAEATRSDRTTQIILTLRSDFLDQAGRFKALIDLINTSEPPETRGAFVMAELPPAELEAAIEKPALKRGVTFEDGLVATIANDFANQDGSLPLLQYALTQLWDRCIQASSPQRTLTIAAYEELGGVNGALQLQANQLYGSATPSEKRLIQALFLELVQIEEIDGNRKPVRRRVSRDRLEQTVAPAEQLQPILDKLIRNRLVMVDDHSVSITHEALLTALPLLKTWLQENQEKLYLRDQVEVAYRDWRDRFQQADNALLSGALLAAVEGILDWQHLPEANFIQTSLNHRDRLAKAQLRRQRQLLLLASGFLLSLATGAFIYAQSARKTAIAAQDKEVDILVTLAESQFQNHQQLEAFKTSLKALSLLKKNNSISPEIYLDRIKPILYKTKERNSWQAHSESIYGLSLNHNLEQASRKKQISIVSSDLSGETKIWNTKGELIEELPRQSGLVRRVTLSHKGDLLASTSVSGLVKVRNIPQKRDYILGKYNNPVFDVKFNRDDSILASVSSNSIIRLWSTTGGINQKLPELKSVDSLPNKYTNYTILGFDIHPLYNLVAFAGEGDDGVWLWNWETDKKARKIGSHSNTINTLRFSPDGKYLATGSSDGTIKVWLVQQPGVIKPITTLSAHKQAIYAIGFSSNGKLLITGGGDKSIKLWELFTHSNSSDKLSANQITIKNIDTLEGHTSDINRLEFVYFQDPKFIGENDKLIVSASDDKTIRVWQWQRIGGSEASSNVKALLTFGCSILEDHTHVESDKSISSCTEK